MVYKCLRCGYNDIQKYNVKKHLNRKKTCDPKLADISVENCLEFLKKNDYELATNLLYKEIEKLKNSMNILNNSGDQCTNVIGNINNNNINITINSYEKTDYTVLKDKLHTCIKNGIVDEAKLIKLLHFNKDAPQNHNVMIENKREKTIKVFNGEKFEDSDYSGREGIWDFSQDTINKTGNQDFVEDEDYISLDNSLTGNKKLNKTDKCKKINILQKEMFNGTEKNKLKNT
jgi:hypothetical protein